MTTKYQIFISSTYEDLRDERRAVTEQILQMGHIPVGMELFQASDDDQWTYIRNRLQEMDYYVVILAQRYGSCDATGMSYTEKEYRLAVDLGIPVIAFILSPQARQTWAASRVEHEKSAQMEAFRALCLGRMSKQWSTATDLALAVTNALQEMFRSKPRPGLVPASDAASPEVLRELARLSEENNRLTKELEITRATLTDSGPQAREVLKVLKDTSLLEFYKARKLTPHRMAPPKNSTGFSSDYEVKPIKALKIPNESIDKVFNTIYQLHPKGFETRDAVVVLGAFIGLHKIDRHGWLRNGKTPVSDAIATTSLLEGFVRMGLLEVEFTQRTIEHAFTEPRSVEVQRFRYTALAQEIVRKNVPAKTLFLAGL